MTAPKIKSRKLKLFSVAFYSIIIHLVVPAWAAATASNARNGDSKPNIVIILADDMGFDDVSFRGSNHFLTPNIDALAYSGVILQNMYTPSMCTPSRSALLTGKYPINTGMQHYVIPNDQPWGLPINETTMAQIFKENGYFTALMGKWHLGMSRRSYTPTLRGFDKHFGYLGAYIDYFNHTLFSSHSNFSRGHDFRDNFSVTRKHTGSYVTDLLTEATVDLIEKHDCAKQPLFLILSHLAPHSGNDDKPLQAPEKEINKFSYIHDTEQKTYAAMMSILDNSVGEVINALSRKEILNNTIILFLSDNGGPTMGLHSTTASNYPLRGQKNSPWEGGLRSSATIWYSQFERLSTVWKQNIYIADLLPTLATAAGIQLDGITLKLDGLDLWSALKYGYESLEREIVHNIDDIFNYVSYTKGKWKFINGTTENGKYDGWLGMQSENNEEIDPRTDQYENLIRNTKVWRDLSKFNEANLNIDIMLLRNSTKIQCQFADATEGIACQPLDGPCLFDIERDPCEQNNVYDQYKNTKIMHEMLERIEHFQKNAHMPNNKPSDPFCDPKYYNYEWTWWEDERKENTASANHSHYIRIVIGFIVKLIFIELFF